MNSGEIFAFMFQLRGRSDSKMHQVYKSIGNYHPSIDRILRFTGV